MKAVAHHPLSSKEVIPIISGIPYLDFVSGLILNIKICARYSVGFCQKSQTNESQMNLGD